MLTVRYKMTVPRLAALYERPKRFLFPCDCKFSWGRTSIEPESQTRLRSQA
jgi:hypothetical protein